MAEVKKSSVAASVPFDNTDNGFLSTDVQNAIEEIGVSASPGFGFGRSGIASSGTWLQNESVPSNKSGRYIAIDNPKIVEIFTSNEDIRTYTIQIYEHEGNEINLTLIGSLTVTSARGGSAKVNIPITKGKQLALLVSAGSVKNIVAGVIIKGDS